VITTARVGNLDNDSRFDGECVACVGSQGGCVCPLTTGMAFDGGVYYGIGCSR
jgi:hypothetical protein